MSRFVRIAVMRYLRGLAGIVCLLGVFFATVWAAAPDIAPPKVPPTRPSLAAYEHELALARKLRDENSHKLAQECFERAATLAPTEEQRRWCELWALAAQVQTLGRYDRGQEISPKLDAWLAPYANNQKSRDSFWSAVKSIAAELAKTERATELDLHLEVASFWGQQSPSAETTAEFHAAALALGQAASRPSHDRAEANQRAAQTFLREAAVATKEPSVRAELLLLYARALSNRSQNDPTVTTRITDAFAAAAEAARGTAFDAEAQLRQSLWLSRQTFTATDARSSEIFAQHIAALKTALAIPLPQRDGNDELTRLRQDAQNLLTRLAQPRLELESMGTFLPGSAITGTLTAQHVSEVTVSVHPLDAEKFLQALQHKKPAELVAALPATLTQKLSTGIAGPLGSGARVMTLRESLPAGRYALLARDAAARAEAAVQLITVTSAQALLEMTSAGDCELHVFDQSTGQPLAGATGKAWLGKHAQPFSATPDGRVRFSLPENPSWERLDFLGEVGGQPFLLKGYGGWSRAVVDSQEWLFQLVSDRRLYRPGETAHWKVIGRTRAGGELRVLEGLQVKLTATDQHDHSLGSWDVTLNRFGTASGSLSISATQEPTMVDFTLKANAGNETIDEDLSAFHIDNFRPPEAKLTLETQSAQLQKARAGGEIEIVATARYFTGESMPAAKIELTATFQRDWRDRWVQRYYDEYNRDDDRSADPWEEKMPAPVTLIATTDAQGQARVRVPLPSAAPRSFLTAISAQVQNVGTQAKSHFEFTVFQHGYTATLQSAAQLSDHRSAVFDDDRSDPRSASRRLELYTPPEQPLALTLNTRDGRENPTSARGEIVIERRTWEEIWRSPDGRLVAGEELRDWRSRTFSWPPRTPLAASRGWEKIHAAFRDERVDDGPISTDATGQAVFETPKLAAGYYRVLYFPETPAGKISEPLAELTLFVADATTSWLPFPRENENRPRVIPCAQPHAYGQPLRALVILPQGNRRVSLRAFGETIASEPQVMTFAGNVGFAEFPWQPGYWAGAKIAAVVLSADGGDTGAADFDLTREPNRAVITVTPTTTTARPGDKSSLHLCATDANGQPLVSEVALSVADAAVASLNDEPSYSIAAGFLGAEQTQDSRIFISERAYFFEMPKPVRPDPSSSSLGGAAGALTAGEEVIMLSAFQVNSVSQGYAAASSGSTYMLSDGGGIRGFESDSYGSATRVRANFSYTAHWEPSVLTDARGEATVAFTYPDNLTAWQIDAFAIADGNRFGAARVTTTTSLPFQGRLRTPRTLVAGDTAWLTGTLVNATDAPLSARAQLELVSKNAESLSAAIDGDVARSVEIAPRGEAALAWSLRAMTSGDLTARLTAQASGEGDAIELNIPVREDGLVQRTGVAGRAGERPLKLTLELPSPLDPQRSGVEVQVSPGIVPALVEALPFLIDYPYGCVEQTMSRFLPAAAVAKTLSDLDLDPHELARRESQHSPPLGAAARFNELDAVIHRSLARLREAQNYDGSFGWWPGGPSNAYMTAYVLRGLNLAAAADIAIPEEMHEKCANWIAGHFAENLAGFSGVTRVWMLSALTDYPTLDDAARESCQKIFNSAYDSRAQLTPAGIALLAQAAHTLARTNELSVLLRNLENGVTRARSTELGETAQWGHRENYFDGLDGAIETTALCLQSLLLIEPQHPLVEPTATWLLVNRQSGRWNNTRDTALALLALDAYARSRGESAADGAYTLRVNGHEIAQRRFDRASLLAPATFTIDPVRLRAGKNAIELVRTAGTTPCFVVATARSWASGESVKPIGDFLKISREFSHRREIPTLLGHTRFEPQTMPDKEASLPRGDQLECRLIVEVKHDLEYVMIASPKPAGCEPLNPLSGWDAQLRALGTSDTATSAVEQENGAQPIYREEHDDRSVFFLERLPAGRWEIRYSLRASFAGDYRALPASAEAMYVPVITANGDSRRLKIANPNP